MTNISTKTMLLACLGAFALVPGAHADPWNQKTVFTFSGPVEIPGQVLPAGTYVFKLANSHANRRIVQVFNQSEDHVFGTFLAIADYRLRPSSEPIITFHERPAGSPDAIRAWFYPGRNYGHEFVYPKAKAVALAAANHVPVPAMPAGMMPAPSSVALDSPAVAAMDAAPLKAEKPTGEEVDIAAVFAPEPPQPDQSSAALSEKLPSTATTLPLMGLLGLVSLGTAGALRLVAAKVK